jgi:hypothetical protein
MRVKLKDSDDEEEEDPIIGIIDLKWHKECVESVWKLRLVFFLGADVKSQQRHFMTFLRPLLGYKNDIPNKEGVYVMKFWLDICWHTHKYTEIHRL